MVNDLKWEAEKQLIENHISFDAKVVIGISGGPDSLAMMHVLKEIYPLPNLVAAHLNHKLREEADDEARFVGQLAESWGISVVIGEENVQSLALKEGKSIEEAARQARYEFLLGVAADNGAQYIMVAHHADDQVETVLLNILRGSGLTGLRGMEPIREFAEMPEIRLVRPFLFTWRETILAYCDDHDLLPMIDSSNEDLAYRRNQMRHQILPLLAQVNPGFKQHIQQLAQLVHADEAYLSHQTKEAFDELTLEIGENGLRLDLAKWRDLPLSLQRRTLRLAAQHFLAADKELSFLTIDQAWQVALKGPVGAESILPENLIMQVGYDELQIGPLHEKLVENQPQLNSAEILRLKIPGSIPLLRGWHLSAELVELRLEEIKSNKNPWMVFIDIGDREALFIRNRKPGERFQPLGMGGHSISIQDFMVNIKLPAQLRDNWPIVATLEHPIWIVGYRIDERAIVTPQSQRIVQLHCTRTINDPLESF